VRSFPPGAAPADLTTPIPATHGEEQAMSPGALGTETARARGGCTAVPVSGRRKTSAVRADSVEISTVCRSLETAASMVRLQPAVAGRVDW